MYNGESQKPKLVLVMGGIATGKSYFINQNFSNGYVHIDAGKIFILLSEGNFYDFPSVLEDEMNAVGLKLTTRALMEKMDIVLEIIGENADKVSQLIENVKSIGYSVCGHFMECDNELALERNENREDDNISAYYTQPYHYQWLDEAIKRIGK